MISNERAKQIFSGDGSSKKFQIPFDFFQNTAGVFDKNNQITVILTDAAGTETTLTEDTDYEVETHAPSGSGSSGYSGYVTLNTAPAVGEKLTIMRDVPLTQEVLTNNHETDYALDKLTMALQQQQEVLSRALINPASTPSGQEKTAADFIPKSGGTFTGPITLSAGVSIQTANTRYYELDGKAMIGAKTSNCGLQISPDGSAATLVGENSNKALITSADIKSTYSSTGTDPVNGAAVASAISSKQDALSAAQLLATNSGATTTKISGYDTHLADTNIHVTSSQKAAWSAKQDALSAAQMAAVNSTIDSSKVAQIVSNTSAISNLQSGKQDTISDLENIRSGAAAGTTALADLSEKADADLSNVSDNIDYVVESFYSQSGYSWWKKYKSGWLEQGGRVQMIDGASTTVSFLKPFATEYYTVVGAQRGNNVTDASKVGGWLISEQTASTIKVVNHSGGTNNWYWHACGKGAV